VCDIFRNFVLRLDEADGMDDVGGISLKNAICLLFTWVLIFFCLMKGIKSSGKVAYSFLYTQSGRVHVTPL